jgi:hypothetical protein
MFNNTDGAALTKENELTIRGYVEASGLSVTDDDLRIRGCADAPVHNHYDEKNLDTIDPSPCAVFKRHFKTKKQFLAHLLGGP